MVDLNKVRGPEGQKGPEQAGQRPKTPSEEFDEMMKKVQKTDADQQKKRKHKQEAEEEEKMFEMPSNAPATPIEKVTPFESPMAIKPTSKAGPMSSAMPKVPDQKDTFSSPMPQEGMEGESGLFEDERFLARLPPSEGEGPPPAPPRAPSPVEAPPPPYAEKPKASIEAPQSALVPEAAQREAPPRKEKEKRKEESPEAGEPKKEKKAAEKKGPPPIIPGVEEKKVSKETAPEKAGIEPPAVKPEAPLTKEVEKEEEPAAIEEALATPSAKEEETKPLEVTPLPIEKKEEKKPIAPKVPASEAEEEAIGQIGAMPVAPIQGVEKSVEAEEKKEEKKEVEAPSAIEGLGVVQAMIPETAASPAAPPAPYTYLHPQVLDLFERMVGVMSIMTDSGMTETTITLSQPQFASSVFFGTQIIIREYATAPMAYNIQLLGTPQAVALFEGNTNDLMAAFQSGAYNFRVNRLETALLPTERPLFRRKGEVERKGKGEKDQDQQGER